MMGQYRLSLLAITRQWHGEVWRDDLNNWFGDTPVMIWHCLFHELIGNDASWELLARRKMPMQFRMGPVGNEDTSGELGLRAVFLAWDFFEPARHMKGMQNFLSMMHESGVTTAADMGTGIFGNPRRRDSGDKSRCSQ